MHIYFVSLGCDKNLVDSEKMLALLTKEGYELTDEPEQAEIIVVNTCAFIHDAKQESIETLLELAEYKKTGKCKVLIASGCLAERYQYTILEEMPEIDGVIGTTAYDDAIMLLCSVQDDVPLEGVGHVRGRRRGQGCAGDVGHTHIEPLAGFAFVAFFQGFGAEPAAFGSQGDDIFIIEGNSKLFGKRLADQKSAGAELAADTDDFMTHI